MTATFLLCQVGAFFVCFLSLSFFEWAFHRYAFHTPRLNRAMFRAHTLVHHQIYKEDETYHAQGDHPDHVPMNWWALPAMLAAHLPLFFLVQWATGIPLVWGCAFAVCAYFAIYESIHWAMHVPRAARFLGRFRAYRFLDAHHRAHHKHQLSNLNVVLPLADLVLGTLRNAEGSPVRIRVDLMKRLKHPFSGLSHLAGAVLSLVGLIVLLVAAQGKPWHTVSFAVYGASLVFLYTASSLYHLLRLPLPKEERLLGLDRAAIYTLIAGTYTPICLLGLPTAWGWSLLGVVWGLAVVGILVDIISRRRTPDWLQAVLYLVTGWAAVVAIGPLVRSLPSAALGWLVAGCLLYTVGAVICVTERPRLRPGFFGAHDLWHVLVMAGSACHFVLMVGFLTPR